MLDLAGSGLFIKPFGISLFTGIQWSIHEYLNKLTCREKITHQAAITGERADERAEHNQPCICKQFAHLTDSANILDSIIVRKAKILAESVAHVITVQQECVVTALVKSHIQCVRDGRFSRTTQAGKPEQARFLVFVRSAISAADFVVVPDNIAHTALHPHSG